MKYVVILGDGMADYPVKELGYKTPLQCAIKPNIDRCASLGELGLVKTVPEHLNPPGSDIANMAVLGYDPDKYYTGRSPLEAVSMGIDLNQDDLAVRCNLVTLSDEEVYEDKIMMDYSSDEISSQEAAELISFIDEKLGSDLIKFYAGISYRHCLVWKLKGEVDMDCTPPHDILTKRIGDYLPTTEQGRVLLNLMKESEKLLKDHPVNKARIEKGLNPATSIWLWGEGRKPYLDSFSDKYKVTGAVVSAVDLIKGLGLCAGLKTINLKGVTGTITTDFSAKANSTIDYLLNEGDFVYVHIEAPDECGHRFEIENKVRSIELIDEKVVGPIFEALSKHGDFKMMILPDHATPLSLRTHTHDPVPYIIYDSTNIKEATDLTYDEECAKKTSILFEEGHTLMDHFLKG